MHMVSSDDLDAIARLTCHVARNVRLNHGRVDPRPLTSLPQCGFRFDTHHVGRRPLVGRT